VVADAQGLLDEPRKNGLSTAGPSETCSRHCSKGEKALEPEHELEAMGLRVAVRLLLTVLSKPRADALCYVKPLLP
jgi:hypothetical protein